MIWMWRKAYALSSVYYAYMLEYRAELYLWALSGVMPFFLMGLWVQASQGQQFALTDVGFARYFLAVFVVRQFTNVWVVYEVEQDVLNGRMSPYLLQPLNPVWRYVAGHVGERLARVPFIAGLVAVFFLIYPKALFLPSLSGALLAVLAMLAAFMLRFIMQYAFAMLAFWTERANAIEDLFFMLYLFLSGFLAPLDVFPPAVRELALLTPFPYLVYLPAQLLVGGQTDLGRGALTMTVWAIVFLIIQRAMWHFGLRRYSAMGA